MRKIIWTALLACLAILPLRGAEWVTHSGDNQRTGWQKNENAISKDSVKNLKLLWKITLDTKQRSVYSLYGPLIVERAITDRGFKELAIVAGADNDLFAVDADLGRLFWKKHFEWHADVPETTQASFLCPGGLTAWPVLSRCRSEAAAHPCRRPRPHRLPDCDDDGPGCSRTTARRRSLRGPLGVRAHRRRQPAAGEHQHRRHGAAGQVPAAKRQAVQPRAGRQHHLHDHRVRAAAGTRMRLFHGPERSAKTVRYWRSGSGGLWGTAGPALGADGTVYAETGDGQPFRRPTVTPTR